MTDFGVICYTVVAVLYGALSVLLLTSWRGRRLGLALIAAATVSTVWALVLALHAAGISVPVFAVFVVEVLRGGAWITFLTVLVAQLGVSGRVRILFHLTWVAVLVSGMALWFGRDYFEPFADIASVFFPGGLLIALVGLVLIEQLYRNTAPESRWGIKPLALGLGGIFAYDLFAFSQGVLIGGFDLTTMVARGAVNILFVPLIAMAARRSPDWELKIFVSRQVVFYTTSIFAVGLYLLLMSLGGYALVIFGGTWGGLAQIVFFVGAVMVLLVLLFSNTLRAQFRVFLSKHFFQNKYDYREEWLRLVATLAGFEDSSTRQIVIKAMAQIVGSPAGLLWALDSKQRSYELIATYHASGDAPNLSVDDPIVEFINKDGWLVDLGEFERDPATYGDLVLPDWIDGIDDAWLIVPLITGQNLVGLVMLMKAPGPPKLNYEDRDLLKTVGSHIAVHLAQEKSDILLAEAQQFEAYNRLTAFLMHDLNNLIAQQSLIVKNAEKHKRNPEFVDDAMGTIANSVNRMKRVMDQLKRGDAEQVVRLTELKFIVSTAVDRCSGRDPAPTLELNGVDVSLAVDQEQLTMVLTHLIQNAQDATSPDGRVAVSLDKNGSNLLIKVEDTGSGMSSAFVRDRLFRPFDSTKGSQGMGIGAYQARETARRLGGDLTVQSAKEKGTTVTMTLPVPN